MNAADKNGKEVIVLDRVDPLGGNKIEGAMVSPELQGRFTSYFNIPTQYGMTVGELARYYKKFGQLSVKLEVVPLLNWDREKLFNETQLAWQAPSPSLPTFEQGILYSIFGPLETTKLAVGRGVSPEHAFKYYGAPWITMSDALTLSNNLNQLNLPGLFFEPVTWTPDRREHKGEVCYGFQVKITSLKDIQGFYSLIKVTELLYAKFGNQLGITGMDGMLGEKWVREAIMRQCPVTEILNQTLVERQEFMRQRETVLMY